MIDGYQGGSAYLSFARKNNDGPLFLYCVEETKDRLSYLPILGNVFPESSGESAPYFTYTSSYGECVCPATVVYEVQFAGSLHKDLTTDRPLYQLRLFHLQSESYGIDDYRVVLEQTYCHSKAYCYEVIVPKYRTNTSHYWQRSYPMTFHSKQFIRTYTNSLETT